jgi:ACS family glucarate transporter-like MFS transporter
VPQRYRVLALLFFLVLVMYLDRLCIAVAGPRMQAELGLAPHQWGWVIGAFTIAYAAFEVPGGALGDRLGPKRVLTRIVLWWSGFTALTGAVSGLSSLLAVRFLFGAGEAGAFPNCTCVISRWIPVHERARATSVFWTATAVGGALTPLLVVPIQQAYGWRAAFVLFGSLGVVWVVFWRAWFRDDPPGKIAAERPHVPAPWSAILRNRNFYRILAMYHAYCWGAYFYLSWLPTYLQTGRGMTEDQMRIAASLPSWAGFAGILAGGWLSDLLARRYSLRVARSAVGASSLLVAGTCLNAATLTSDNRWAVGLLTLSVGVMDMMLPVAWSVCLDVGREHAGAFSGAMNMCGQVGSFLSSIMFGYMVEWTHSYNGALMPLAAMLLVSGALFATIDPADPLSPVVGLAPWGAAKHEKD